MAKSSAPSTQEHLPIAGIQDGVVIMTDGSVRVVLKVEPINFDLKSEQEQNGIIYAYQSFLNSLDFPIQIVIQSKRLELERYLMKLQQSQKNVTNELLRIQIEEYVGFVRQLISVANIMSKRFYVVIQYSAVTKESSVAAFGSLLHRQPSGPVMDQDQFARFKAEGVNRAAILGGGLGRLGVKSALLGTQELIELFYGVYNPDLATEERLTGDVGDLNSQFISSPQSAAPVEQGVPDILADLPVTGTLATPPPEATPNPLPDPVAEPEPENVPEAELPTEPTGNQSPINDQLTDQGQPVQPNT